ncbi:MULTISPECIES: hypothetical protein [Caulobacter]|nr:MULTISPECIES: hypothetical protein [Caulobacter]MBQ1562030.1 hypothetical protein [Caulobacter sp.]
MRKTMTVLMERPFAG